MVPSMTMDPYEKILRAAPVDCMVLLMGESGTGQEYVARYLHDNGPRKAGPFVAINCAAVPPMLIENELFHALEQADGGTLFIDEVADLQPGVQTQLLHVLETSSVTPVGSRQDRKVNVRVISATGRDIAAMVRGGEFREDLFYRLNVVTIELPPLHVASGDRG